MTRRLNEEQNIRRELMQSVGAKGMTAEGMSDPKAQDVIKRMEAIDRNNREYLTQIVMKYGWLGVEAIGAEAANGAFMIALHSEDLRLMRTAETELETYKGKGGQNEVAYAAMADRVALLRNLPMHYGVQGGSDHTGQYLMPVVADRTALNANRKRIDQPPIEDYLAQLSRSGQRVKLVVLNPDGFPLVEPVADSSKAP